LLPQNKHSNSMLGASSEDYKSPLFLLYILDR
jgi:hypothetical protein